jgi:hypothetical protein
MRFEWRLWPCLLLCAIISLLAPSLALRRAPLTWSRRLHRDTRTLMMAASMEGTLFEYYRGGQVMMLRLALSSHVIGRPPSSLTTPQMALCSGSRSGAGVTGAT